MQLAGLVELVGLGGVAARARLGLGQERAALLAVVRALGVGEAALGAVHGASLLVVRVRGIALPGQDVGELLHVGAA